MDKKTAGKYAGLTGAVALIITIICQITHNGANATFLFPEEPTPTTDLSYSFLVTLCVGILVIFLIRKRYEI